MTSERPVPPEAVDLGTLMMAMTGWEFMSASQAQQRVRDAASRLGMSEVPYEPKALADIEGFVQALANLRTSPRPMRLMALRSALEVSLGSGTLPLSQNLALRTVVDALRLGHEDLVTLFWARTGERLPLPWDPSLSEAWVGRESGGPPPGGNWDDAGPAPVPHGVPVDLAGRIQRIKALAMLGLDEEASSAEIRQAFLRISKVHHPDHYASQGPEAAQEADQAFRRLKDAFDFLRKDRA